MDISTVDEKIQSAISQYIGARNAFLRLSENYPDLIGGNDNIIGRIGEYIAIRFLEGLGQTPTKVKNKTNPGFDLEDGDRKTQVKVITAENKTGSTTPLKGDWNQFILIELDDRYKPNRIGILNQDQFNQALNDDNNNYKAEPTVRRSMLNEGGIVARYGKIYSGEDISVYV